MFIQRCTQESVALRTTKVFFIMFCLTSYCKRKQKHKIMFVIIFLRISLMAAKMSARVIIPRQEQSNRSWSNSHWSSSTSNNSWLDGNFKGIIISFTQQSGVSSKLMLISTFEVPEYLLAQIWICVHQVLTLCHHVIITVPVHITSRTVMELDIYH